MAFPVVESTAVSLEDCNTVVHCVTMPACVVSGDLLIFAFAFDESSRTIATPSGWTKFGDLLVGSVNLEVFRRVSDGTEGCAVAVTVNGGLSMESIHFSYRISGHDSSTAPVLAGATATSCDPNPPNLTPAGGANDFLWIAGEVKNRVNVVTSGPACFTNLIQETENTIGRVASARRSVNATSLNPGIFTHPGGSAGWAAFTVAVYPTISVALSGTITDDNEADIRAGCSTIILTVSADTWICACFNAQRQAIICGLDAAACPTCGWNTLVRDSALSVTDVVRTCSTVVTITMPVVAGYCIIADEIITATIPAAALVTSCCAITASPTFTISNIAEAVSGLLPTIAQFFF